MNAEEREALQHYGWTAECEHPLEIRHGDGSTATGQAANTVIHDVVHALRASRNVAEEIKVPAEHFCQSLSVNVDNDKQTDKAFREFVRNTLPIVIFERINKT